MIKEQESAYQLDNTSIQIGPSERKINMGEGWNDFTYILPVTEALNRVLQLRDEIRLSEGIFLRKNELHITLLGLGTKELIRTEFEKKAEQGVDIMVAINKMLSELDFSFDLDLNSVKMVHNLDYDPEAVRTKKGRAAFESEDTVIMDVNMPGLKILCDRFQKELGIDLGTPASHITLYIKDNGDATGLGIGIHDLAKQIKGEIHPHIELKPLQVKELLK